VDLETFAWERRQWGVRALPLLDSERTLVLAFGAPELGSQTEPWSELRAAYPRSHILGCSTAGEILGSKVSDGTVAVAVLRLPAGRLACASAPVHSAGDSFAAGADLAGRLMAPDLQGIIVLSDGLCVNGSELVRGLSAGLPPAVVVTGGLAADGPRFERTWVLTGGEPKSGVIGAVGIYGDAVRIGHGSKGGWDMFGPERMVTRSEGSVLYELDGKPALHLYKEYLGERAAGLPATALLFPLALRAGPADQKRLVRTVLAVDEASQSMTFAGDIPTGYRAQLMKANFDRLVQGASDAAAMTGAAERPDRPTLALAISCVGRRLVLGERTEEEIEATLEALPANARQVGFYSYGEISPYASGSCDLHNQTMTLTTISER
jgi:hypothetical protein